jgi:soluble lytic murein transglycosylase-like protein
MDAGLLIVGVLGLFALMRKAPEAFAEFEYGAPPGSGPYIGDIIAAEDANGIPRGLLANLLYQESHFRDDIIRGETVSSAGALGIAQFTPDTARQWLGSADVALQPQKAIAGAGKYLAYLARKFGSWRTAVIAYNWGEGNVSRKYTGDDWGQLPLETVLYVTQVYDWDFA